MKSIDVILLNNSITMEDAQTLLDLESTGFLCFGTGKLEKPVEVLYNLFKEGFTFIKKQNLFKIYYRRTEVFNIDFNQGFCRVSQIVLELSLFFKSKVYNAIGLLPDKMLLLLGMVALSREEIKEELKL